MGPEDLKRIRKKFGLNQIEFAKVLGIGSASIKRFETGVYVPDGVFAKLYKVLDKHPEVIEYFKEVD